ncbi:MAG: bifunctional phosphopantothenoylcysteine decarboxylase/phosphopantothenate--cysteine ligase CoaBC [Crocinitomicaceae bacterium]
MRGKRILLGITGGIAAYKIAFLIRSLKKAGAEVKCIMTPASVDFISPLVVSTLSENPVGIEFWNKDDGSWNNHVEYGLWADVFVIAPLTANTLSKMATGACDNILLATYLSMKSSTVVAPAMDLDMYKHPTTRRNLDLLVKDGVAIIPAGTGELASGLVGEGRMAEPEEIFDFVKSHLRKMGKLDLEGKKVIITAGPTYEQIDPVRFIGNHSSGKMGNELAQACAERGAEVILVMGPSKVVTEHDNIIRIDVTSAEEMFSTVQQHWSSSNLGIFAAAVADYRPKDISGEKIKKSDDELSIQLVKNPDILYWTGQHKSDGQVLVGFALETQNLVDNATKKLEKKNLDFIVMNSPRDEGAAFGVDTNKISILDKHNKITGFELKSKKEVAEDILDHIIEKIK